MGTTREQWLTATMSLVVDEILAPVLTANNIDLPPVRYSITAPKSTTKTVSRVLGECWSRAASGDATNEIFITALLGESDSVNILAVAIHEYLHAALDNQHGHAGPFVDLCKQVGLEGGKTDKAQHSFTATKPSDELTAHLTELVIEIGEIPHAAMTPALSGKKVQKNRQLLVACNRCEFKFRASQKTIDSMKYTYCLSCDDGTLAPKL